VREFRPDGFWTSDDLRLFCRVKTGHQKQLFMQPELFREFIKPYYARIGAVCREQGVHWWLHSCGNNARIGTDILGDLAEVGLDVFHPVQKGTMDEVAIS
jgi:hypothetical protein